MSSHDDTRVCLFRSHIQREDSRRPRRTRPHPEENPVRVTLVSTAVLALALSTVAATTASAGGNGAQRSGLSPQAGSNDDQCVVGSGAGTNGFAIVNAPGKPGSARFVNGEVSLKRGPASTTYTVN